MVATKTLGPWVKGLNLNNNRDFSLFLQRDELGEATNVIYTPEGFLEPRPGYKRFPYDFGFGTLKVLGSYVTTVGTTVTFVQRINNNIPYIYAIRDLDSVQLVYTGAAGIGLEFTHFQAYTSIDPAHSGAFIFANLPNRSIRTTVDLYEPWGLITSAMGVPASDKGFIIKDRLFLFDYNNSKMWWSPANYILDFNKATVHPPGHPQAGQPVYGNDTFAEEPIESVHPSERINCVEFINNNFYIFKRLKTYMFTYQSKPGEDGYLRKINETLGGLASTVHNNSVIVFNGAGIFRIEGTEFFDLQRQLSLAFNTGKFFSVTGAKAFLFENNNNLLIGFQQTVSYDVYNQYYYVLNLITGAWSEWKFNYLDPSQTPASPLICAPGSMHYRIHNPPKSPQHLDTESHFICNSFNNDTLMYTNAKPSGYPDYHMDGPKAIANFTDRYIPNVSIKTAAFFGDSPIKFVKLYRMFIRFYMSDVPTDLLVTPTSPYWELSVNYNSYKFNYDTSNDGNPKFVLHPSNQEFADKTLMEGSGVGGNMAVYTRTYQVPIPQQRIKEFVVELKRKHTKLTSGQVASLVNQDADRVVKAGYYFRLSAIWIDYQDKAGI